MLRLEAVTHRYGRRLVLDGLSLDIDTGVTALIGANGAGKTTMLSIAAGALRPVQGTVEIGGQALYRSRHRRGALAQVALMPQSSSFPTNMTAAEVVSYLTWMRGYTTTVAKRRALEALDQVSLGAEHATRVRELSGGMLRRVCLAQALAAGAEVLLLDEPSTGLDPEQRRMMVQRLSELSGTVLLSSHVMEDVVDLAERVVVLDAGRLIFDGSLPELAGMAPKPGEQRPAEAGLLAVLAATRARQ